MELAALLGFATCGAGFAATLTSPRSSPALFAASTFGFGLGLLTLLVCWFVVVRPGALDASRLLLMAGAVALTGLLARCVHRPVDTHTAAPGGGASPGSAWPLAAGVVGVTSAAMLLNAWVWPFADGDALAVYGPLGRAIAASGTMPVGERLYEAYPPLVPLLFAAVEWVRQSPSEPWSRLATTAYSVGGIGLAWQLARDMGSARAAWLAALLLVSTPVFGRWASSGYADLPAGFYLTLATVLAWRWWRRPQRWGAVMSGIAAGLALWTKNSVVTLVVTAVLLPAAWAWVARHGGREPRRSALVHWAAAVLAAMAVAAPWYARNAITFGFLLPPTAWTDQAPRDVATLVGLLRPDQGFGVLGWLAVAFVPVLVWRTLSARDEAAAQAALVGAVCGPFVAAWWWLASYDPRFLVTVLPIVAAYGGVVIDDWAGRASAVPARVSRLAAGLAIVAVGVSWAATLRRVVEHKRLVLQAPWMDELARHRVRVGGLYELGRAIESLPSGTRVAGVPVMARYYIAPARLADVRWAGSAPGPGEHATYLVARIEPATAASAPRDVCRGETILRTSDGWILCRAGGTPADGDPSSVVETRR